MKRDLNVEKGKKGFQPRVNKPSVPTSDTRPLVRDNNVVGSQQPNVDSRALAFAAVEAQKIRTRNEVAVRAHTYAQADRYLRLEPLTDDERQQLEAACWDDSLSEFGDPPKPPQSSTLAALDTAQRDDYVGGVVRQCYFNEDGNLRQDVLEYDTANTVEMNVAFAEEVARSPHNRELREIASLVHATTEFINDRDTSSWPYAYPNNGLHPDLDKYVLEETGVSLLRIENERLASGLVKGHWGPNSG